jgi:hypothetical protein
MKLEERQKGLLKLIADYRERECKRILAGAKAEASELLRQKYRTERAQLHERIVAERSRARSLIQAARAETTTRERWTSEQLHLDRLRAAWPLLRSRLLERWRLPDGRRQWASSYLQQAVDALPRTGWAVRHAPELVASERSELLAILPRDLGRATRFQADGGIEAGLIIESAGAVLDASLEGLLKDRPRLEARLLALFREDPPP